MRVPLKELLEKLGVDHILSPYETQPWFHYDAEQGLTCSAEVRMGPAREDVEAEIQFLRDEPEDEEEGSEAGGGPEQVMRMRMEPLVDEQWSPKSLIVRGEDYVNKMHNWEEKGCDFFRACIQAIQMGEMPIIDELIKENLSDDDKWGGGSRGRVGRKSPKINAANLLGMKK